MGFGAKGKNTGKTTVVDGAKAVWIGNLPEEASFKELMELGKATGCVPAWAEKSKPTTGYILFKTPSDAKSAIQALNNAYVGDNVIQADKWTGKAPLSKGGTKGGKNGGNNGEIVKVVYEYVPVWKPQFEKNKGKGKGKTGKSKGKKADPAKSVWLGGVPEGTTFKELMDLGNQAGDCKWAEVLGKKGQGILQFATVEEVATAVEALDGAQIGDATIEVDVWVKATKKTEEEQEE